MPRTIVTGAAGFIGFALGRALARSGDHTLILIDNFVRGARDHAFEQLCQQPGVTFLELDLSGPDAVDRLPEGPVDYVFHLAALNGTQNFYERPYEVLRHSTLPTFALVEKYVKSRSVQRRFVYAGSSEAYAGSISKFGWQIPTAENVPLCIEDPTNARWSYAVSKMHGEVLTCTACAQFGVPFTGIRYHNAYGPRMGDKHVIPDFVGRMKRGEYVLYGHRETRSLLYVDDAVDATLQLAQTPQAADQIVNVGSDREVTMAQLGALMMRAAGIDAPIELQPAPPGSVKRRVPDLTKLRALTGFEPRWSLEHGVTETVSWYRSQP